MRKLLKILVATIILASVFTVPAIAAGGEGTKAVDVCWMQGDTEIRATFQETPSGIVHEFRYDPDQRHYVFMPKDEFNEPDEGNWNSFTGRDYEPCDGETDLVTDFLPEGTQYWYYWEYQN